MDDTDEDIDTAEIEEDWIEYNKRKTKEAEEKMRAANVPCWIETQRNMKWRLAMRIASHPETRWTKKAAKWNPGLSIRTKACRAVGRPNKRWEDDINQFLKPEETEETEGNDLRNNDTWIWAAADQKRGKELRKKRCRETENLTVTTTTAKTAPSIVATDWRGQKQRCNDAWTGTSKANLRRLHSGRQKDEEGEAFLD